NRMDAVAVGADRRVPVAARQRLAVNTFRVMRGDGGVAGAAGASHVELEDAGERIVGRTDGVMVVAVGADGRFRGTVGDRTAVDAGLIRDRRLVAQSRLCHRELLAVTGRARCGDVHV